MEEEAVASNNEMDIVNEESPEYPPPLPIHDTVGGGGGPSTPAYGSIRFVFSLLFGFRGARLTDSGYILVLQGNLIC